MIIFIFIDCKCFMYIYQAEVSFLDKIKHIMSLSTIQNVVTFLSPSFTLTYNIYLSSSSSTNLAISICSLVFHVFISRIYLTPVKAVTLILKHATFLWTSKSSKSALTNSEQNYQKAKCYGYDYANDGRGHMTYWLSHGRLRVVFVFSHTIVGLSQR